MDFFKDLYKSLTTQPEAVFQPHQGAKKVAILMMSIPPELCASLFHEMRPEQVQEITSEIAKMPPFTSKRRIELIAGHLGVKLTEELLASPRLEEDLKAALEAYVKTDSKSAARSLTMHLHSWQETTGQREESPLFPPVKSRPENEKLSRLQKAAVLFTSMPRESAAEMFHFLRPDVVAQVAASTMELPTITPATRCAVICEFLELDPRNHDSVSASKALEGIVKINSRRCAELIQQTIP